MLAAEEMVGRGVRRRDRIEISFEGRRFLHSFGTRFFWLMAILTVASRGSPLLSAGVCESRSRSIGCLLLFLQCRRKAFKFFSDFYEFPELL